MFNRLSLRIKLASLVFASTISFAVLVVFVFVEQEELAQQASDHLYQVIQTEVEQRIKLSTDLLAESLGTLVKGRNEAEQIRIIAEAIEDFRFEDDKSGYFFAYKEYVPVAHPTRKDLIGKSLAQTKDANGVYYVRELYDSAKTQTKEGKFVHFVFSKPMPNGSLDNAPKIAYAALIPNTQDIWLSTGVYIDTLGIYTQDISSILIDLVHSTMGEAVIIGLCVFICVFVPLIILFYRSLFRSVRVLRENLTLFFKYLSHESTKIDIIELEGKDEFAQMVRDIKENIKDVTTGLEQDQKLVKQSLQVIERAKQGYADTLIELKGHNPELNKLRDSMNDLLELLQNAVG
ncbi:cache domain-containing protein, partial [Helicobacter typhlonius]